MFERSSNEAGKLFSLLADILATWILILMILCILCYLLDPTILDFQVPKFWISPTSGFPGLQKIHTAAGGRGTDGRADGRTGGRAGGRTGGRAQLLNHTRG